MPRKIEFDEHAVLSGAMQDFRRNGYAGTSIRSLERATGVSSGSLYHSYDGKEGVFAKALEHYNSVVVRGRIHKHLHERPPEAGLLSLFLSLLDEPGGTRFGCLLTNTAVEFGSANTIDDGATVAGLGLLKQAFQQSIDLWLSQNHAGRGSQLARRHRTSAIKLLALYQGVLVLFGAGNPTPELKKLVRHEIGEMFGESE